MISNDLILREPALFIEQLTTAPYSFPLTKMALDGAFFTSLILGGIISLKTRHELPARPLLGIQICAGAASAVLAGALLAGLVPAEAVDGALTLLFVGLGLFAATGLLFWIGCLSNAEILEAWMEVVIALFLSALGYIFILYAAQTCPLSLLCAVVYILTLAANACATRWAMPAAPGIPTARDNADTASTAPFAPVVKRYAATVLCIAALNYVLTSSRMALADASPEAVNLICATGIAIAALLLFLIFFIWRTDLEMRTLYQVAFPFIALAFLLLPFAGAPLRALFMLAATTLGTMGSTALIYIALEARRSFDVPACSTYGIFSGTMHIALYLGLVGGSLLPGSDGADLVRYSVFALVLIYIFLLIFLMSRRRIARNPEAAVVFLGTKQDFERACGAVGRQFGLTPRETEIMGKLAEGLSASAIAEGFSISESTVRTHGKNLYRKLGIHAKSELLDLIARKNEA